MRLTFRQGIARYQTDIYSTPTFLRKSSNGSFVDLVVSPDPTVIIFAHKAATYLVEETKTVVNAWGPFSSGGGTKHLYWDLSLLDASLTRGFTNLPPIVSGLAPSNPSLDQHWYDTTVHQMKVWNGVKWVEKLRVFAGTLSSSAVLTPAPLGSQVGATGSFNAGGLVLDSFLKPLRQSDGTFVTSTTEMTIVNSGSQPVKFESEIFWGMAQEYIPKFSVVQIKQKRFLSLNRSDDWKSRAAGIVTEDLYQNEVGKIITDGFVRNEQWDWPVESVGRPVFSDATGQITLTPPEIGVCQIVGFVSDQDTIYIDIKPVTILDDITVPSVPPPQPLAPVADFYVTPLVGTAPLTVTATSTSLHNPTAFAWDFGNNGTIDATSSSASHTFSEPGTYSVRLHVTNPYGANQIIKENYITVESGLPAAIKPNLGAKLNGPLQVTKGQQFSISVVTSNDGLKAATQVKRTVSILDIGPSKPTINVTPVGTGIAHQGALSVLTLPEVATIASGQQVSSTITMTAPDAIGLLVITLGVTSSEADGAVSDNTFELTIRVK